MCLTLYNSFHHLITFEILYNMEIKWIEKYMDMDLLIKN